MFVFNIKFTTHRRFAIIFITTLLVSIIIGIKPDIYHQTAPFQKEIIWQPTKTPVHLSDDVMISLRSGYMIDKVGKPSYNEHDLAQASTSYLAPYVFFVLYKILPGFLPVLAYAALGLLCATLTTTLIALQAKFFLLGCTTAALLTLTTTNVGFVLLGWDHLFQTLLLVWAASVALREKFDARTCYIAIIATVLGALYRPDGVLVAGAIACIIMYNARKNTGAWRSYFFLFTALIAFMLIVNYVQFERFSPTTTRLKLGASPSIGYSTDYLWKNIGERFSAGTLLIIFVLTIFSFFKKINKASWLLLTAALMTALAAAFNSDVFADARMLWMPACIAGIIMCYAIDKPSRDQGFIQKAVTTGATIVAPLTLLVIFFGLGNRNNEEIKNGVEMSLTAPNYFLMEWIGKYLNPSDGAVGLYWLGMAYHLPAFEVADFLGKADEAIATLPVKWGMPGHNKWDVDLSLAKWNPQVIVPTIPSPWLGETPAARRQHALAQLAARDERGFIFDLLVNPTVQARYLYCHVLTLPVGQPDTWGLYVRQDVAQRHAAHLRCQPA
ncbi:MAG: hypothetical protein Q4F13_12645 [Pseudomonadota bacterium]|nr:hypothetical protein [Pseudomonadota bacterium]